MGKHKATMSAEVPPAAAPVEDLVAVSFDPQEERQVCLTLFDSVAAEAFTAKSSIIAAGRERRPPSRGDRPRICRGRRG